MKQVNDSRGGIIQHIITWFIVLFLLFLPFDYHFLPNIGHYTYPLLSDGVQFLKTHLLGIEDHRSVLPFSDSINLYIQTFLLVLLSVILGILSFFLDQKRQFGKYLWHWRSIGISYYLSLQLFKYGFNKVFKHQFYLPEPNILYTPLGQLSKDILYWSTIGSSYFYTVTAGLLELLPAILLLFRRTRLLGALLAAGIFVHILMINIGFGISVKLYSSFLLFLCILLIFPHLQRLYQFFVLHQSKIASSPSINRPFPTSKKQWWCYTISKALIIGLILFESLFLYFKTGNFNDDKAPRPFLHGAYAVQSFQQNGLIIPPLLTNQQRFKNVFFHRKDYFITQNMQDEFQDYQVRYDFHREELSLKKDQFSSVMVWTFDYSEEDSLLVLKGVLERDTLEVVAKRLEWERMSLVGG